MIKSVLQVIPSYVMSVYLLPEGTIKDIEIMMNSFWWGGEAHNKGIQWLAWDRMPYPKALGGLVFKDLHTLNLAMIAKQGWKMLTQPHTLVAKLYKTRWIVENGTSIKAINDPWLRRQEGAPVSSPQIQGAHAIIVNDLMLPSVKRCDMNKIESIFPPEVAKNILKIPLFDTIEEDKLIWVDSPQGQYSVKSGYNLMLNLSGRLNYLEQQEDWACLWKIHAPQRKTSSLENLQRMPSNMVSVTRELDKRWDLENVIITRLQQFNTVAAVIKSICRNEDGDTASRFVVFVWTLLNNRNNSVWSNTRDEGRSLGIKYAHLWQDWKSVQQQQLGGNNVHQQQQVLTWQKSFMGWQKCNVDAAFHNEANKTSAGWCLRDCHGNFNVAGTFWKEENCSIIEGEAIALLEALLAVETQGITHVIFETDSKSVVDAIHTMRNGSSEI